MTDRDWCECEDPEPNPAGCGCVGCGSCGGFIHWCGRE